MNLYSKCPYSIYVPCCISVVQAKHTWLVFLLFFKVEKHLQGHHISRLNLLQAQKVTVIFSTLNREQKLLVHPLIYCGFRWRSSKSFSERLFHYKKVFLFCDPVSSELPNCFWGEVWVLTHNKLLGVLPVIFKPHGCFTVIIIKGKWQCMVCIETKLPFLSLYFFVLLSVWNFPNH